MKRRAATLHSGFAQFKTATARDEFLREILEAAPELEPKSYRAQNRPTIVFENLTDEQLAAIRESLVGRGQWMQDIQFHPLG